ncbi:MAG: hypothetical protein KDE09_22775 [Anaerolineales bacterium]|nr:hypothetical protein [Anaerolineales bacterium]MCB0020643.1 hypothetical protein [Anaerolineales bacterium]
MSLRSTQWGTFALIVATALVMAAAFAPSNAIWGPVIAFAIAAGWIVGELRNWEWVAPAGLILYAIAGLFVVLPTENAFWGVMIIVVALCAWNSSQFDRVIALAANIPDEEGLVRRYYRRLLTVAVAGGVISIIASRISLNVSFSLALVLAIVAVIGLSQAFIFLRRESD